MRDGIRMMTLSKLQIKIIFTYFLCLVAYFLTPSAFANVQTKLHGQQTTVAQNSQEEVENALPLETHNDPYEGFNRAMFVFNDKLDIYFLKPLATLYNAVIPKPLNQGINNFFVNLNLLPTIANDILQFHFQRMLNDTWRFGINSTIGVAGLFDVGSRIGLKYHHNDFGLTLATWGWGHSNYLVLPFFGPRTVRDMFEVPVDYYAFSVYPYIHSATISYSLYGLSVMDQRAQLLQYQPLFEEAAIDKYVFIRNAYLQRRTFEIEQAKQKDELISKKNQAEVNNKNVNNEENST